MGKQRGDLFKVINVTPPVLMSHFHAGGQPLWHCAETLAALSMHIMSSSAPGFTQWRATVLWYARLHARSHGVSGQVALAWFVTAKLRPPQIMNVNL